MDAARLRSCAAHACLHSQGREQTRPHGTVQGCELISKSRNMWIPPGGSCLEHERGSAPVPSQCLIPCPEGKMWVSQGILSPLPLLLPHVRQIFPTEIDLYQLS
jgi:hypothetical protein